MALRLKDEWLSIFAGVNLTEMPDSDRQSIGNAVTNAKRLTAVAASVQHRDVAQEITDTGGADCRDTLRNFGDRGPDAIRKAIDEALAPEEVARRFPAKGGRVGSEAAGFCPGGSCPEFLALDLKPRFLHPRSYKGSRACLVGGPRA